MLDTWREQARAAAEELCVTAKLRPGELLAVGCSSSEIVGARIGTGSSEEAARAVLEGLREVLAAHQVQLAAQCCEHLNRALIVERETAQRFGLVQVNVIPQPKAGGSFATAAYHAFADPVAVEDLRQQASAGLDIGATLIGMHLRPVVVPVRLGNDRIGQAAVIAARTRPKFVGGARAAYDERLL